MINSEISNGKLLAYSEAWVWKVFLYQAVSVLTATNTLETITVTHANSK